MRLLPLKWGQSKSPPPTSPALVKMVGCVSYLLAISQVTGTHSWGVKFCLLPRSYLSPQHRGEWKSILEEMMDGRTRKVGKETISVSMEMKTTLMGPRPVGGGKGT